MMKFACDDHPPKYCHVCGKALIMSVRRKEFDIYTGNEIIERVLKCPAQHDTWFEDGEYWILDAKAQR
jgi:hypothetical protein